MPRPLLSDRPIKLKVSLPQSVYTKLMLYLYSPLEGTVPHGAVSKFFEDRTREFLDRLPPPTQGPLK